MARVLQIKRGLKSKIPTLAQAEFGFTTDANAEELYIGNGAKNIQIPTITSASNGHYLGLNGGKSEVQSYNTSTNITAKSVAGDNTNVRKLAVYSATGKADKSESVVLVDAVNGTETSYKIYGEHNKPTASDIGAADASHNQAASTITAGTLAGKVQANATAAATLTNPQVRDIQASTTDLTAGTSSLTTGTLYFVYE